MVRSEGAGGRMRTLLLLSALAWLAACQRAAEFGQSATEQEENVPVAWNHRADEVPSEVSHEDMGEEEEEEEEEEEPAESMYIVDDSVRVEPVVKPKQTKTEREKSSDRTKRRKNKEKKNKKKKVNPCEAEYKSYCIHGECKYLENLKEVTCQCHHDYFGERCGEQSMKSQQRNDTGNYSKTFVVVAVLVPSTSFIAIIIVIIVIIQIRKTSSQYEEKEERKKLRQENGNGHVPV